MPLALERLTRYVTSHEALEKNLAAASPDWLKEIRTGALARFNDLGFPKTKLEDWKYTSVSALASVPFEYAATLPYTALAAEQLQNAPLASLDSHRVVFVNGRHSAVLSSAGDLPGGLRMESLAGTLVERPDALKANLGACADFDQHAFVALNTAFLNDGALIEIPAGAVIEKPIYILYASTHNDQPAASYPRTLIVAGANSQATVVECHIGTTDGVYLTNAVTEIVAGDGSIIDHFKIERESPAAFHIATIQARQGRSSNLTCHSFTLGGALVRNDVNVVLDGEGAECTLDGLYVLNGAQHVDNHTLIDHARPHCTSHEVYKGVLDGKSTGVFNGRVIVRKDAQKTDARQSNKNLLLSESAQINTKPQLEIFADDVKCSHGATIGQIDQEAIFYLRSRGIGLEEARALMTYAFINDVVGRVKNEAIRSGLEAAVFAQLTRATQSERGSK